MSVHINVQKERSPRYPRISILNAVEHARALYNGAHRSVIDPNTAYRVMGFTGKNGASATALGAVRQFGLVEGLRGDIKISQLALKILEPSSRGEYVDALHEAAEIPDVYAALYIQYPEGIPRSDEPIRSFLIRTLNFSKGGADDCISAFRETLAEIEREANSAMLLSPERGTDNAQPELVESAPAPPPVQPQSSNGEETLSEFIRISLTRDCVAELRFSGPITADAVSRLLKYIDLMKDVWAESQ